MNRKDFFKNILLGGMGFLFGKKIEPIENPKIYTLKADLVDVETDEELLNTDFYKSLNNNDDQPTCTKRSKITHLYIRPMETDFKWNAK